MNPDTITDTLKHLITLLGYGAVIAVLLVGCWLHVTYYLESKRTKYHKSH